MRSQQSLLWPSKCGQAGGQVVLQGRNMPCEGQKGCGVDASAPPPIRLGAEHQKGSPGCAKSRKRPSMVSAVVGSSTFKTPKGCHRPSDPEGRAGTGRAERRKS